MTQLQTLPLVLDHKSRSVSSEDPKTWRKLQLNYQRAKKTDQSQVLDTLAEQFDYETYRDSYWNPPEFSLLYGTPLWEQSSEAQRTVLNQLYWVAYYSQIISLKIATIFFNQTSAAGLFAHEGFRLVCDTLDLETNQERCHINAFRAVIDQVEQTLFEKRVFSYLMRSPSGGSASLLEAPRDAKLCPQGFTLSPFAQTMIFADTDRFRTWCKGFQHCCFGLLSASNTFLACQYLTIRGLRSLNAQLIEHKLSNFNQKQPSIPSQISYYHFLHESFHFNTSTILGHEVIRSLTPPTPFERWVVNFGIRQCQHDHYHVSVAVNGIFWYDPALYQAVYTILLSPTFGLSPTEAKNMMKACYTQETEGLHRSFQTHKEVLESYKAYLEPLDFIWRSNKEMRLMSTNSIPRYLKTQQQAITKFFHNHVIEAQ